MLRFASAAYLALLLASIVAAHADGLPDGVGVLAPSGSVFTTEITAADADDYVFQGYPGMVLSVVAKAGKGSTLEVQVTILRPDGSVVSDDDGLAMTPSTKSASAKFTLDATGWWKVRVAGANGTSGAYSVSLKYTSPVLPALPQPSRAVRSAGAISPPGDIDEFPFQGYDGQTCSLTLTVPKASGLDPVMSLLRPDGTVAETLGLGTEEKALRLSTTLDADGLWRVRVLGEEADPAAPHDDVTSGSYALSVKPGRAPATGLVPDANGQYRIALPAAGGASIGYAMKFKGAAPVFNSLIGPDGNVVSGFRGGTSVKSFRLDTSLPQGEYVATFDAPSGTPPANVSFTRSLSLARGAARRVAKLGRTEPVLQVNGIDPTAGGPGTVIAVRASNLVDPGSPDGKVVLLLGHVPLDDVELLPDQVTARGTVPDDLPEGVFDVVVLSTSGQPAARAAAFRRVPPPVVTGIDPSVGPDSGGFEITLTGTNFRAGVMRVMLDGFLQPLTPFYTDDTTVRFLAPPRSPGFVRFGTMDSGTQLTATLGIETFEYVGSAAISRLVPALIPALGNETVTIQGANFDPTDRVCVETGTVGVFEDVSATQTTFVNTKRHQFLAPPRGTGEYRVHVQNSLGQPNPPKSRLLTYFSFGDITAQSGLGAFGQDDYDAWASALGDFDKDGDQDLFLARRGNPAATVAEAAPLTRVLRNDGSAKFGDVTASTLPAASSDDWRADRIWATDMNQDGWTDLVLVTNAIAVPPAGRSHTRILVNEQRGGSGAGATDRVFRDRTIDLMAVPRTTRRYGYGSGTGEVYVSDDWRGLDVWIGDLDKGGAGPPEILLTHDEMKNDDNPQTSVFDTGVYCGNYCVAAQPFPYNYAFYWGGSRMLSWDKSARGGLGRFKFDPNFFPRKGGPVVPPVGVPGGIVIPACSTHYSSVCKATFTPFTGKHIVAGDLDADGKPDIAVLSSQVIQRRAKINDPLHTTSSLQIGMNKFNPADGAGVTDLTELVFQIGGDLRGDTLGIGQPGFPDGNALGVLAISTASASGGGSALRLLKVRPDAGSVTFEDISGLSLPAVDPNDRFQASQLAFVDIDKDGDQDLVLLADAAPSGSQSALRVLRNEVENGTAGVFRRTLGPLLDGIALPGDHHEGVALAIGDVTGDGLLDYVVSRATPTGAVSETRIVETDK